MDGSSGDQANDNSPMDVEMAQPPPNNAGYQPAGVPNPDSLPVAGSSLVAPVGTSPSNPGQNTDPQPVEYNVHQPRVAANPDNGTPMDVEPVAHGASTVVAEGSLVGEKVSGDKPAEGSAMANLMNIVVGNSPKKRTTEEVYQAPKPAPTVVASSVEQKPQDATSATATDVKGEDQATAEKPAQVKKRRKMAHVKKVLVARKEKDMAATLLNDKRDLVGILPDSPDEPASEKRQKQKLETKEQLIKYLSIALATAPDPKEGEERSFNFDGMSEKAYVPRVFVRPSIRPKPKPVVQRRTENLGVDTNALRTAIGALVDGGAEDSITVSNELNEIVQQLPNVVEVPDTPAGNSGGGISGPVEYNEVDLEDATRAAQAYLATGVPGIGYSQAVPESGLAPGLYAGPSGIDKKTPLTTAEVRGGSAVDMQHPGASAPTVLQGGPRTELEEAAPFSDTPKAAETTEEAKPSRHVSDWADEDWLEFKPLAEVKVQKWQVTLRKALSEPDTTKVEDRFNLQGPISFLISGGLHRFISCIRLKSLVSFLELKKTETGGVCELLRVWRQKCNLPPLTVQGVAKYFIGIGTRLELAVSSVPPVPSEDRVWVNDPIIALTGAAQDFLIGHLKVKTGKEFLDIRTKDLSISLVAWRANKGMPELKGSGKVAMISGWKSVCKEALEVDGATDAPIVSGDELMKLANIEKPSDTVHKKPSKPPASKMLKNSQKEVISSSLGGGEKAELNREGRYALHSPLLLEDALGEEVTAFLKSAEIGTASLFLDADHGALTIKIEDANLADNAESAKSVLQSWIAKVRRELKQFEVKKKSEQSKSNSNRRVSTSGFEDPIEGLSAITQRFLSSMGITSGAGFLSTRTTDVANEFVKFRIREGMPELKGLGAIASVSGWKAQCRKVAVQMGLIDVADLEPDGAVSRHTTPVRKETAPPRQRKAAPDFSALSPPREGILKGKSILSTRVRSSNEGDYPQIFEFDLSLRSRKVGCPGEIFLTYKGATTGVAPHENEKSAVLVEASVENKSIRIPVLSAVTTEASECLSGDTRAVFNASNDKPGLLSVSELDVRPYEPQDIAALKDEIVSFVCGKPHPPATPADPIALSNNIVLGRKRIGHYEYFFYSSKVMEKGQVERVTFPSVRDYISRCRHTAELESDSRAILDCAINLLAKPDLIEISRFLSSEVSDSVSVKSAEGDSSSDSVRASVKSRKRIDWIARRLLDVGALKSATLPHTLLMGSNPFEGLPHEQFADVSRCVTEERRLDIESALAMDADYASIRKKYWCSLLEIMQEKLLLVSVSELDAESDGKFVEEFASTFQACPEVSMCENEGLAWCSSGDPAGGGVAVQKETKVASTEGSISFTTYREAQLDLATIMARAIWSVHGRRAFDPELGLLSRLQQCADNSSNTGVQRSFPPRPITGILFPLSTVPDIVSSRQYFLGLVWPVLRKQGWRMTIGDTPDDVSFVSPTGATLPPRQSRQEQKRKRNRLSNDAYNVGLGCSMKLTRRLCIWTSAQNKKDSNLEEAETSVQDIADQYLFLLQESLEGSPAETQDRAEIIVKSFVDCFDEVAASLPSFDVELDGKKPSAVCGGEYLVQFLFIVPTILRQSKLPLPEVTRSLELAQDMLAFVTKNFKSQLKESFCPPMEVYADEVKPPSSVVTSGLKALEGVAPDRSLENGGTVVPVLTETVLEEDKKNLTEFACAVLSQSVPCRATDDDLIRKYRRIHVGFPGLMCRHCKGVSGEGRYFFTSSDSVATATTVFDKHVSKCKSVPSSIKEEVARVREFHTEQRKSQATGSQQRFFLQLWERLRSSNIEGELSVALVFPKTVESLAAVTDYSDTQSFTDHRDVLDHVRAQLDPNAVYDAPGMPVYRRSAKLEDAVNLYYQCISYHGRIYDTPSMPSHLSPEWMLSKILPRRKLPKRIMAG